MSDEDRRARQREYERRWRERNRAACNARQRALMRKRRQSRREHDESI